MKRNNLTRLSTDALVERFSDVAKERGAAVLDLHTGFGPGAEGGGDGYFEGEAPYPRECLRARHPRYTFTAQ
jgi:hypothetical protein